MQFTWLHKQLRESNVVGNKERRREGYVGKDDTELRAMSVEL